MKRFSTNVDDKSTEKNISNISSDNVDKIDALSRLIMDMESRSTEMIADSEKIFAILLVEDEIPYWYLFQDALEYLRYDVAFKAIEKADDAIEVSKEFIKSITGPLLFLIDFNLKTSVTVDNGAQLISKINSEIINVMDIDFNIYIGIISTSNKKEEQKYAEEKGANFWLVKNENLENNMRILKDIIINGKSIDSDSILILL